MADYDVVIIGSGVAGAICAAGLAASGKKVLVLEAADNGLGVAQREQFKRMWDPAAGKSWNTPYLRMPGSANYPSPGTNDISTYFEQSPDPARPSLTTFKAYYQRLAGGSTWAWRGNTPRMMPNDFRVRSVYFPKQSDAELPDGSSVADWPVSYDDMKPWYLKAEQELGVSGNAEEWESLTPRDGAKFPMPAQPKSYSDQVLIKRLKANGLKSVVLDGQELPLEILTMAQARNSEPYDGRPACEGNHDCVPLCPTNAKYDATVHLKRALRAGATIRMGCIVTRLEAGANGVISKVFYKDWKRSTEIEESVSGTTVVLAANPIESPRILLSSKLYDASDRFVGRNLMDHVQYECLGLAPEAIYPYRGPQTLSGIDSLRDGRYRSKFGSFRITLGNDGWGRHGNPTTVLEKMVNPATPGSFAIGKALRDATVDKLTRIVRLSVSSEQLPHPDNRVELSDKLVIGIPRPKIRFEVHPYTQRAIEEGFEVCKKIFAAMDTHVEETVFHAKDWVTAAHPMGTCRMGTDKSNSVVDKYGRCHNHPNLFMVGAAVFPTGSATNPVLTIAALSLMAIEEMKRA